MRHAQPILSQLNNFDCNNKNLLCQRPSEKDVQKGDILTVLHGLSEYFTQWWSWHKQSLALGEYHGNHQKPSACGIPSQIQWLFISSRRNKIQRERLSAKRACYLWDEDNTYREVNCLLNKKCSLNKVNDIWVDALLSTVKFLLGTCRKKIWFPSELGSKSFYEDYKFGCICFDSAIITFKTSNSLVNSHCI